MSLRFSKVYLLDKNVGSANFILLLLAEGDVVLLRMLAS